MEKSPKSPEDVISTVGTLGWMAVAGVVAVWDWKAPETLSHAFRRTQPVSGFLAAVTVSHLMGWLPERLDPFYMSNPHR